MQQRATATLTFHGEDGRGFGGMLGYEFAELLYELVVATGMTPIALVEVAIGDYAARLKVKV